jgi:hypothetical protein
VTVACGPTLSGETCAADLAVGHNWVRVTTHEAEPDMGAAYDYAVAPRDSAVAVAEVILANLRD